MDTGVRPGDYNDAVRESTEREYVIVLPARRRLFSWREHPLAAGRHGSTTAVVRVAGA